jgi:ATP-binding cassette, subfamily B, bacterial PglK
MPEKSKINQIRLFFHELSYLLGEENKKIPRLVLLFVLLSLVDVIGLGLIGPYILLITSPNEAIEGVSASILILLNISKTPSDLTLVFSFILVFIFLLKMLLGIYIESLIILFGERVKSALRSKLMTSYQNLNYLDFISKNSSYYVDMMKESINAYGETIRLVLKLTSNTIVGFVMVFFLLLMEPKALILFFIISSLTVITYNYFFSEKIKYYGLLNRQLSKSMLQKINEAIRGYKEIRVFLKKGYFHNRVKSSSDEIMHTIAKYKTLIVIPNYIIELAIIIFVALLTIAFVLQDKDIELLIPILALFGIASIRLVPIISYFSTGYGQIKYHRNYISRLYYDIKKVKVKNISESGMVDPKNIIPFNEVKLDSISYRYPNIEYDVLSNVTITIKSGESVGLMGPSGSGKTTLVNILLGLIRPQSGDVTYNGNSIWSNVNSWHGNVAYLPQETFIIDGSLRENIAFGLNNIEIDDNQIMEALKKVSLIDLIYQLPKGLDAKLGDGGVRLSGGQRQRVALARAFYNNRSVIVMDESTSSLDYNVELEIIDEIKKLRGKVALIIIAHRMSTLKYCDRIYKLTSGRLVQDG